MTFTFADLTTVAGATAAAALISGIVQILKVVLPGIFTRLTGASWTFLGLTVVYGVGALVLWPTFGTADTALAYFIAWIGALMLALGIHQAAADPSRTLVKP